MKWNFSSNWTPNIIPTSEDNVVIPSTGVNYPLNNWINVSCAKLIIEGSNQGTKIYSVSSQNKINCSSLIIENNGENGLYLSQGEIEVDGNFTWNGKLALNTSGIIDVNGDINIGQDAVGGYIQGGQIFCSGNYIGNSVTEFKLFGGKTIFDGSGDQYCNLDLNLITGLMI